MGCSLLALVAAAAGYIQWQLREAGQHLVQQQAQVVRMSELLSEQNRLADSQSQVLSGQLDVIARQSEIAGSQVQLLRAQQSEIAAQADAVGTLWVVVNLSLEFHALRGALMQFAESGAARSAKAAHQHLAVFNERLRLLEMMDIASEADVALLGASQAGCEAALSALSSAQSSSVQLRLRQLQQCDEAAVPVLAALVGEESNRVVKAGSDAKTTGQEIVAASGELLALLQAVQGRADNAGRAARTVSASTNSMARLTSAMNERADEMSARHLAIRETVWTASLVVSAVGAILFFAFFRAILGPIRVHARTMREHAHSDGSLPQPMGEHGPEELREFAASFNQIREALADSVYSKHYVDNILQSMGEGLAVCSTDGRINLTNPALASLLGMSMDGLHDCDLAAVIGLDTLDPVADALHNGGEVSGIEVTLRPLGGAVIVLASVASLYDETGAHTGSVCVFLDIAERRKVEESNRILASFPEQNPGPVLRCDAVGRLLYANPAAQVFLDSWGIPADGKVPSRLLPPIVQALDKGNVVTWTERLGEDVYVLRFSPQSEDGHVNIFGFNETARLRQEAIQTLRGNVLDDLASGVALGELLAALIDGAQGIFPGAVPMLALAAPAAGEPATLVSPRAPGALRDVLGQSAACVQISRMAGDAADHSGARYCPDAVSQPELSVLAEPLQASALSTVWRLGMRTTRGEPLGVLMLFAAASGNAASWPERLLRELAETASLVIDRLRSEQALAASEEKYRSLVDGSIQGIFVQRDLHIQFANPAFANILGYPSVEAMLRRRGADIMDYFPRAERERLALLHRTRSRGDDAPSRYETEVVREDGLVVAVEHQVRLINWEGEAAVQVTVMDISERKRAERELVEASECALQAARSKSQFLATMSHELRTPLNGVLGMLQLMNTTELSKEQVELVEVARESGESLLALINDVLDYSRLESGRVEAECVSTDLRAVLEHVADLVRFAAEQKSVVLRCEVDSRLPATVYSDPLRLKQILTNLAGNAVKFTEQGQVTLSAEVLELDSVTASVRISVADTGIGIPADALDQVFESFTQADSSTTRRFGGSGLGLAICKQLVQVMKGTMRVSSTEGEGSVFSMELPFALAASTEPAPKQSLQGGPKALAPRQPGEVHDGPVPVSCDARILVVDDNIINQKVTRSMLLKLGYACDVAGDGLEALEMIAAGGYAAVLMDCQMPNMDGFEATRRVRASGKSHAALPIVALTANAMAGDQERCISAGMNDYLGKPVSMSRLAACIDHWVGKCGDTPESCASAAAAG